MSKASLPLLPQKWEEERRSTICRPGTPLGSKTRQTRLAVRSPWSVVARPVRPPLVRLGFTSSRALTRRFVGNLGTRFPKAHEAWGHHERSIFLLAPWT